MKTRFFLASLILFLLVSPFPTLQAQPQEFREPVFISDATVIPSPGAQIENCDLLIEGDRIKEMGRNLIAPDQAQVIDGSKLFVYAGFIDAATRQGIAKAKRDETELQRAEGDMPNPIQGPVPYMPFADRTGIRPEFNARDLYDTTLANRGAHRKAGFTTAMVIPHIGILSGRATVVQLNDRPLRDSLLVDEAAHIAGLSTGESRSWENSNYPGTTMGCMAQFRQAMMDAQWYSDMQTWCDSHPDYSPRPPSDPALDELQHILNGDLPLYFVAEDENSMLRGFRLADEFKARPAIIGARSGWRIADILKQRQVPVVASVKFPSEPYPEKKAGKKEKSEDAPKKPKRDRRGGRGDRNKDADTSADQTPPKEDDKEESIGDDEDAAWEKRHFEPRSTRDERRRLWKEQLANLGVMEKSGVSFAVGSWDLSGPDKLLPALRQAIEEGLSADTALAALTTVPAKQLGLSKKLGSIEEGKLANLTIMTKSFENKDAKVAYVFVEGDQFDFPAAKEKPKPADKKKKKKRDAASDDNKKEDTADEDSSDKEDATADSNKGQWPEWETESEAIRTVSLKTNGSILLKNATILTVTKGTLQNTSILVIDGKIAELGKDLQAPEGVTTIDCKGYFIMPGIIDPHSHMGTTGGLNEWTMSVTPEVRVNDIVNHRALDFHRALAGGVTTIHTMHGSANAIGGQNVVLRLKYPTSAEEMIWREAPQTVKFALGENVTQANSTKKRGQRFPVTRMGVEATMRESFRQASDYRDAWQSYQRQRVQGIEQAPFRRDLRLQALMDILDGNIWVHSHCYRADEILRLLQVAEDFGFRISVLQHVLEAYRILPEIARHGCGTSTFSDWWSYKIEAINAIPHNVTMSAQYGINSTINSDSGEVVRHMNLEAAKSIRFGGLSETEALKLITYNGAVQLGIQKFVGSIEVGKDADLAIFNAHPLDTYSKNMMTLIQGDVYFQHPDFTIAAPPAARKGLTSFPAPPEILSIPLSPAGRYAIVGATVHSISGPVLENGSVLIDNGRILEVGTEINIGADTVVIQAAGLHLYPGMINAGTGLGLQAIGSINATNDNREIGRFHPELLASSAVDPHAIHIAVTRAEGVTTALTIPMGGVLPGQACLLNLNGWSMPEMLLQNNAALLIQVPSLAPDTGAAPSKKGHKKAAASESKGAKQKKHFKALADIRDYLETARRYAKARQSNNPPILDRSYEALQPYLRGDKPVLFPASSYKQILDVLRFAEQENLKAIIYGGKDAWKATEELRKQNTPVILTGSFDQVKNQFDPWDANYRCASMLAEADVQFCFATGGSSLAKQLPLYAGISIAHGLDEDAAMRALTLDAASIFGMADQLGSIETGKQADLILTTGNPCQSTTKVLGEFIAGQPVDLDSIHEINYRKFNARPEPKLPPKPTLVGPPDRTKSKTK